MIWFTSDQHFYHTNIIKYCDRPFKDAGEMNQNIIENYNNLISEYDTIYFLGDLGFFKGEEEKIKKLYGIIKKLKGDKHLILGNHDDLKVMSYINMGFESVHTTLEICLGRIPFFLCHDPVTSLIAPDFYHIISGHVHNLKPTFYLGTNKAFYNVSVDANKFKPINEGDILNAARLIIKLKDPSL